MFVISLLLLLAGMTRAQDFNVTMDDVSVSLTDSKSSQGERFTLGNLQHLSIVCRASIVTGALTQGSFFWRKASVNESATVDPRITVQTEIATNGLSGRSVLNINYPVKSDVTSYVCVVNQTVSATGSFLSAPLLTLTVNGANEYDSAVWPSEGVTIVCLVEGNPIGDIRWSKSADPAFNVTNNNTLTLGSISYEADRGYITCTSKNRFGENSATLFLRVKSPMGYLVPLVTIICEIFIMLLIVTVYEIYDKKKRRVSDSDNPKSE